MKKTSIIISIALLLYSCDKNQLSVWNNNSNYNSTKSSLIIDSYRVSMKDVDDYLHFKYLGGDKMVSISPYKYNSDTVFFIINYEDGWELLSGDKRAPLFLARSDSGALSIDIANKEMLAWINCLAKDISYLKESHSDSIWEGKEDYSNAQSSFLFWSLVSCDDQSIISLSKNSLRDSIVFPIRGHWELIDVDTDIETYDSGKLTETQWGQSSNNYNFYCPLRTDTTWLKASAGCVPVAGAQMLYYLHSKLSVPAYAPDWASCTGYINPVGYTQYTGGASSSTWGYMRYNHNNSLGYKSAAVLIADIGKKVGVNYGNQGSSAYTNDLINVFAEYGISCSQLTYNPSTTPQLINQSLINEMPVIMRAEDNSLSDSGHCFILDGYKRSRVKYTFTYEWVWDPPTPNPPIRLNPIRTEISYNSPYFSEYSMNWGWGGLFNDSFFAISGNWHAGGSNYISNRYILYNFSPIE